MMTIEPLKTKQSATPHLLNRSPRVSRWSSLLLGLTSALLTTIPVRATEHPVPEKNDFSAHQADLAQSISNPEGFSLEQLMDALKSLRVNVPQVLEILKDASQEAKLSGDVVRAIETQAKTTAATEPVVDRATLPPLQMPGPYAVTKQTLNLVDDRRNNRPVTTDLYIPDFRGNPPASIPVVVFSHGLWGTRSDSTPFQESLASYGFVVAAPEHVGSDAEQKQRLLSGAMSDILDVGEFYNRPQDVSFVLNTLEQKNASEFGGRLNLNQVGVFGHSFGGYTAFALGGATIDFKRLRDQCQSNYLVRSLNPSYLMQCRALELESLPQATLLTNGQLQDSRVKFVMAISPVGSALFGSSGMRRIKVPVMIFGGTDDLTAPLIPEQIEPFSWLTTPDKYLIVSNSISHSPGITEKINKVLLPDTSSEEINARLATFYNNLRGISLAFMQVYVAGKSEYRPYLLSSYSQTLNNPPYNFSLIRSLPPNQLKVLESNMR